MHAWIRTMSAIAILAGSQVPLEAWSDEPSAVGQPAPPTKGPAPESIGPSPGNGNSASGVSARPSENNPSPTTGADFQSIPLPISGPPRVGLFIGVGDTLLANGIDLHGVVLDHVLRNTTAGLVPGNDGQITAIAPAADLDLGKILDIRGGTIHVQADFTTLRVNEPNFSSDTGGFLTGFQATPALSGSWFTLSYLTYEQKLLETKLSIEFGRTNYYRYFFLPNSLDAFTHFSSVVQIVGDSSSNPFPTWGTRLSYHVTPTLHYQVGAFADDFRGQTVQPENLGESTATGVAILGEVGSRSEFFNSRYPENFELGVEYNTRHGYSTAKGSPVPENPRFVAADYPGGGFVFFQGMQTLWRGAERVAAPPSNIALYGSVDTSYDKPQPIDLDAIVGTNFTGFMPGRPNDAFGVQVHYQRLSAVEADFESRFHDVFAGPGPDQSRNGFAFEAVDKVSFNNVLAISPLAEYFVDPDNYGNPTARRRQTDGFEIGVLAIVSLGRLFGTSAKAL